MCSRSDEAAREDGDRDEEGKSHANACIGGKRNAY